MRFAHLPMQQCSTTFDIYTDTHTPSAHMCWYKHQFLVGFPNGYLVNVALSSSVERNPHRRPSTFWNLSISNARTFPTHTTHRLERPHFTFEPEKLKWISTAKTKNAGKKRDAQWNTHTLQQLSHSLQLTADKIRYEYTTEKWMDVETKWKVSILYCSYKLEGMRSSSFESYQWRGWCQWLLRTIS